MQISHTVVLNAPEWKKKYNKYYLEKLKGHSAVGLKDMLHMMAPLES